MLGKVRAKFDKDYCSTITGACKRRQLARLI
jgi:hypothetical protein